MHLIGERTRLLPLEKEPQQTTTYKFNWIGVSVFFVTITLLAILTPVLLVVDDPIPLLFFIWFLAMISSQTWLLFRYQRRTDEGLSMCEKIVCLAYIVGYVSEAVRIYLHGWTDSSQELLIAIIVLDIVCALLTACFLWSQLSERTKDEISDTIACFCCPGCDGCDLPGC
jgi:phosphatidylglycerophosphate synthase